jgi:molybdopterin-containing oxidoreductase family iron-sulfur binding subunit
MLRLDRASVILALDADPLLTDPEMIRHARGFADGRRAGASGQAMNRLYAVEAVYSLTGAMADHRLRLESRQISLPSSRRSRQSSGAPASPSGTAVPGVDPRWIDALAKDLWPTAARG